MRILIIEDEPLVATGISRLLRELEPEAVLEGPLTGVTESRLWLSSHPPPDLILADIQLADGISLDIFLEGGVGCPVIFTTAFNEYAIRAFKVNSIDYLLKPVEKEDLQGALHKFHQIRSRTDNEAYLRQIMDLFRNFNHNQPYKERFTVHLGKSMVLVHQREILGFIKEEIIYLLNSEGRRFITDYRSLDEVEELLDPKAFFRVNRQFIIQLPFIALYRPDETGRIYVRMKGQAEEVCISKERAAAFRKWAGQ